MFNLTVDKDNLESVAHVIQVALTPAFLLSAIAALLNVFANRLARVADRVDKIVEEAPGISDASTTSGQRQLTSLRRRSRALDFAVILGACGAVGTCCATLLLFIGALRNNTVASALYVCFAAGLICTVGALVAFLTEMLMASHSVRRQASDQSRAETGRPSSTA